MKALERALYLAVALGWTALGGLGLSGAVPAYAPHAGLGLGAGLAMLALFALRWTYRPAGAPWPERRPAPRRLRLGWLDHVKALVCWLHAFERTYAVAPGLYHTLERYDRGAPLLVTANYHLSVFSVLWHVGAMDVRLLVVDTDGINVWCGASEGQLSNAAIEAQLARHERALLTDGPWLTLVLPKLAFAGVDLRGLRARKIRPLIGPVHARDLPAYLGEGRLSSRRLDRVRFGLRARIFTWLPGLLQVMGYTLAAVLVLVLARGGWRDEAPLLLLGVSALLATLYPLLFPWIPGARFAVKGLWLGGVVAVGLAGLHLAGRCPTPVLVPSILYTVAAGMFFGLAYTGNSAVSSYSRVRAETARFLPLEVALFAASLLAFVGYGVLG